jgi:hypothetical protein
LTNPLGDASDYYKQLYKRWFGPNIGVSKENRNPVCILIYIFEGYFKKDMPTDLIFYFFIEYFFKNTGGCLIKVIALAGVTVFNTSFCPF